MFRRLAAVGLLGSAALTCALSFADRGSTGRPATNEVAAGIPYGCGVQRWPVKTMSDPAALHRGFKLRRATVAQLRQLPDPGVGRFSPRVPQERIAYRVSARLVAMKLEPDFDIHLVIANGGHPGQTMITEFPDPACVHGAAPAVKTEMVRARRGLVHACGEPLRSRYLYLRGTARITGVAFYDTEHGQLGAAPQGIELHPVLRFQTTGCRVAY